MLSFLLEMERTTRTCTVRLHGDISLDNLEAVLKRLWLNQDYLTSEATVWDISPCELPEFDTLMRGAAYVAREKAGRGPRIVAFLSPAFARSVLVRAFRGFERIMGLDVNFFAEADAAHAWIARRRAVPH